MLVMTGVRAMRMQMLRARGTMVYKNTKWLFFSVMAPGIFEQGYLASEDRWEGTGGVWSFGRRR